MLQLVLGIAGTGKTTCLLDMLEQRANQRLPGVFLVPEQFSSSAETMLYHRLGDEKSSFIEVLSFRTLAERILKAAGKTDIKVLSDAGRAVFLRRALDTLQDELPSFAKHRRSPTFCNTCIHTIAELKTAGATPAHLREIAVKEQEPKFSELALIYDAYEAEIQGSAMDPEDRLVHAAENAGEWFSGKACYIDNFDGFTAPEYRMLDVMLADSQQLTVALCCDGIHETEDGLGRFSPVRQTARRLIQHAEKAGVAAKQPVTLTKTLRTEVPSLAALNDLLAWGEKEACIDKNIDKQGLFLTTAPDEWAEVKLAAAKMRSLAARGVPYSRMALICRDIAAYESAVRHCFALYGIPVFIDAGSTIEYTAPVAFIRAAIALLRQGLVSKPVVDIIKTGLFGYSDSEVAALENYVYTWQPKAAEWRTVFDKNPQGLLMGMDSADKIQLKFAEKLRAETVPLLEEFLQKAKNQTVAGVLKQLYLLMDKAKAPQNAQKISNRLEKEDLAAAEKANRAWDLSMDLMDQLVSLVGHEYLSANELDELLLLLVRSTDFGTAPQSLECVIFTSADRMRLADPDYCFVVGLAEGDFPMQVGYSGILTHTDREKLVESGVEMPGSFTNRVLLEEMFFYRALTLAHKGLFLSWPQRSAGETKAETSALEPVKNALDPPPLEVSLEQTAATPGAAFELLGNIYRENTPEAASLYQAVQNSGEHWQNALDMLTKLDGDAYFEVKDKAALKSLVGESMTLSATKAERYYECRFAYYMQQVIKTKQRRRAELSPLESGTFVHYILEMVLDEAKQDFKNLTDAQLKEKASLHADRFVQENLPQQTRRGMFLLDSIKQATTELLCYLRDAAAQSEFKPDALELDISDRPGAVAPLEVTTPDGRTVRVTGKIDRVDILEKDGKTYLCIIDYKTGDRAFSLEDVYCGLNMQMMIYMQTLCKNAQDRYPDAVPAGVLYLSADPAAVSGTRQGGEVRQYKMDGLLLDDASVLKHMDDSGKGVFIPVSMGKNGAPSRGKQKLADLEKIGIIQRHVETMLADMADGIYEGSFPARPLVKGVRRPCRYCPYRAACRHEDGRGEAVVQAPENVFAPEEGGPQLG